MLTKMSVAKQKLFDGFDNGFVDFQGRVDVPGGEAIVLNSITRHNFSELGSKLAGSDFRQLVQEGSFKRLDAPFEAYYKGSDSLSLYYVFSSPYLLLFAAGESQPQRYKIYLEGVWRRQPHS